MACLRASVTVLAIAAAAAQAVRCSDGTPNLIQPFNFTEGKNTLVNRSANGLKFIAEPSPDFEAPVTVLHVRIFSDGVATSSPQFYLVF